MVRQKGHGKCQGRQWHGGECAATPPKEFIDGVWTTTKMEGGGGRGIEEVGGKKERFCGTS